MRTLPGHPATERRRVRQSASRICFGRTGWFDHSVRGGIVRHRLLRVHERVDDSSEDDAPNGVGDGPCAIVKRQEGPKPGEVRANPTNSSKAEQKWRGL